MGGRIKGRRTRATNERREMELSTTSMTSRGGETKSRRLLVDKRLVIEAYKAACILIDWSESIPNKSCHKDKGAHLDLDLEEDLNRWAFLENLFRDDLLYYDQIEEPSRLKAVMASLDLALLLTTRKKDRVSIRRERRKLSGWLKRRKGITRANEGGTLL